MDHDFVKTADGKTIIQNGGTYIMPAEGADPELQHRTEEPAPARSEATPADSKPKSTRKEAK